MLCVVHSAQLFVPKESLVIVVIKCQADFERVAAFPKKVTTEKLNSRQMEVQTAETLSCPWSDGDILQNMNMNLQKLPWLHRLDRLSYSCTPRSSACRYDRHSSFSSTPR